ncbi:fibronectin type III domain-containing protein [Kaarinaea lacus]
MKTLSLSTCALILAILTACSGGGGDGTSPGLNAPVADISGTWNITEDGSSNCPGEQAYHNEFSIIVAQTGNSLTVSTPAGTFNGTIDGDRVAWTGSYPEDGGTTTITAMQLTVSSDGNSLSGTSSWNWSDGIDSCSGTTQSINGARVPGTGPLPDAPTALNADALSQSAIDLTWTDNADNETGFKLERSLSQFSGFSQIALLPANQTDYSDSGLSASTTYYYRVRAYNNNGDSAYSATASAMTFSAASGPAAPSALLASANSSSSIALSWNDNSANEDGFELERSTSEFSGFALIASLNPNETAYTDSGLAAATTYYYRIRAYNNDGDSDYSNTANATTQAAASAPAAPSGLVASATSSSEIDLSWNDNSANETGFKIERSTVQNSGYSQIGTTAANVTTYASTGLNANATYYYRVRAYNASGDSLYSNIASDTTYAAVPIGPSNVSITDITASSARINWSDNADNETGFELGHCTGLVGVTGDGLMWCTSGFVADTQLSANTTSYVWTGLSASTPYSIFIRAFNNAGPSGNIGVSFTTTAGSQTITLRPQYDNLVMISSLDGTVADTVYGSAALGVGCNWDYSIITGIQNFLCAQSLVRFDLSSLTGNTIESATLQLTVDYIGVGYYPRSWHVRAMATDWSTQTVTWNVVESSQYYLDSNINQNAPTSGGQVIELNVTSHVSNWVNGVWSNYGYVLGSNDYTFPYDTSLDAFQLFSNEDPGGDWPKLIVTYH